VSTLSDEVLLSVFPTVRKLSDSDLAQIGKIQIIRKWLSPLRLESQVVRLIVDEIKQNAVAKTKASDIDDRYSAILKILASSSLWSRVKKHVGRDKVGPRG